MRKSKIICLDIETTGLDIMQDEILQVSIINGTLLFCNTQGQKRAQGSRKKKGGVA